MCYHAPGIWVFSVKQFFSSPMYVLLCPTAVKSQIELSISNVMVTEYPSRFFGGTAGVELRASHLPGKPFLHWLFLS
jgi:hypothetical protein